MQDGIYDRVMDKLLTRQDAVKGVLKKRFEKDKPFRTEKIDNDEMLVYYNQMTQDPRATMYLDVLRQKHGDDKVRDFVMEMETAKQRRGLNG
jgi:hypothetical protein